MDRRRILWGHVRRLAHLGPANALQLRRMRSDPAPTARALADAVGHLIHRRPAPESVQWFGRIESMRAEMRTHREPVNPDRPVGPRGGNTLRRLATVASKRPRWARLLHAIALAAPEGPALEFGACVGVSAAYIGAAMEVRGGGHLTTMEGNRFFAEVARENLRRLGLDDRVTVAGGRFEDLLPSMLGRGPYSMVFKDGQHRGEPTVQYFEETLPHLASGGLMVFDDVTWSAGMARAWRRIRSHPGVDFSVDLFNLGVVGVGGGGPPRHYRLAVL